jgi:hypothetical protein
LVVRTIRVWLHRSGCQVHYPASVQYRSHHVAASQPQLTRKLPQGSQVELRIPDAGLLGQCCPEPFGIAPRRRGLLLRNTDPETTDR